MKNRTASKNPPRGRATGPARIPVSGRSAQSTIDQRAGQSGQPGQPGQAETGWSPLKKGLLAAAVVAVGAVGVLALTSGTANAGTPPPRLPGGTTPPRNNGGGGGGGSPANTGSPGGSSPAQGDVRPSERNLTADAISGIQRTLRGLGYGAAPYGVTCSGRIDAGTRSAIRAFQSAYGRDAANHSDWSPRTLAVDGVIGPNTQRALTYYRRFYDSGSC